jgi:predicted alpha/beta-hydrolase family hydrolase
MKIKQIKIEVSKPHGTVSGLLSHPDNAKWLLVLGHGAGAGMRHKFMEQISTQLAEQGIGTLRYQFPYMEKGSKTPDPKPILLSTVRSAITAAKQIADGIPLLAGGKSMGGRMTSMTAAEEPLPNVHGLVFFGFPLHATGQPSTDRADHLQKVKVPMLFLQGTRDTLADLTLLKPICTNLGKRTTLHIIEGADHSFHVLKSSGNTDESVLGELAHVTRVWTETLR